MIVATCDSPCMACGTVAAAPGTASAAPRAATNALHDANRSPGFFARPRKSTASTEAAVPGRTVESGGGGVETCW